MCYAQEKNMVKTTNFIGAEDRAPGKSACTGTKTPSYTQGILVRRSLRYDWEISVQSATKIQRDTRTIKLPVTTLRDAPAVNGLIPAWNGRPIWGKLDTQAQGLRQAVERNSALQDEEISLPVTREGLWKE
jgi:hypothetical protein